VSFLRDLPALKSLSLNSTGNLSDYSLLSTLTALQSLDLGSTGIFDAAFLSELPALQSLNLSSNTISDVSFLLSLPKLREANLEENQIQSLPKQILKLGIEIEEGEKFGITPGSITWRSNPIESPPVEVLRQGHQAIIDYFEAGETLPQREAKVLVVGEAAVGKTSLIKQLLGQDHDPKECKTHDIARHKLPPMNCGEKGEIDLRVWDFGGQDIMHATHQFFLTRRSIYLLVLNSRQNESQSRIDYWLKLIASFGGDSPVIVICNKCDEEVMNLPWDTYQKKYSEIKHYVKEVSCQTGKGIDEVKQRIAQVVAEDLRHVGEPVPVTWFNVKRQLEAKTSKGQDYLQRTDFDRLCEEKDVEPGAEITVLRFLHDLGVVLHYDDEHPLIEDDCSDIDTKVLNPAWVSAAIYKILNDGQLATNHGVLTRKDLNRILQEVSGHDYDRNQESFILGMMEQFDLCFKMPDRQKGGWLIPDLLPKDPRDTGEWDGALCFRYEYSVLPSSVISRFIVRMDEFISKSTYWRYGVVLKTKDDGVRALVTADLQESFLDITLLETKSGLTKERREFLAVIRAEFSKIHSGFSEKFEVTEFAESTQHPGVFLDYRELIDMERAGETEAWVKELKEKRPITEFLDGVTLDRRAIYPPGAEPRPEPRLTPPPTTDPRRSNRAPDGHQEQSETPIVERSSLPWRIWCLICGFSVAGVATLIIFAEFVPNWMKFFLGVGTSVSGILLAHNPERHWMRKFSLLVTAAISFNAIGFGLSIWLKKENGEALFTWHPGLAWPTAIAISILGICCIVGEWVRKTKGD